MEKEEKDEEIHEDELVLVRIGSKNRVCLPPNLMEHLCTGVGGNLAFFRGKHEDGRPYAYLLPVTVDNLKIESTAFEKIYQSISQK